MWQQDSKKKLSKTLKTMDCQLWIAYKNKIFRFMQDEEKETPISNQSPHKPEQPLPPVIQSNRGSSVGFLSDSTK